MQQQQVKENNKFVLLANMYNISLQSLTVPKAIPNIHYWKYDTEGEKLGTIFIHLVVENFTQGYSIFENHASCEKSYFLTKEGQPVALAKYADKEKYKAGDKTKIIHIPDLILIDFGRNEIINAEGKQYKFRRDGIDELI